MAEDRNWVNVKVPEEVRQEAKHDERTYWEIMVDGLENPDADESVRQVVRETIEEELEGHGSGNAELPDEIASEADLQEVYDELLEVQDTVDQMLKWLDGMPIETADEVENRLSTRV